MLTSQRFWTFLVVAIVVAGIVLAFPLSVSRTSYDDRGIALTGPVDGPYVDDAMTPTVLQLMNGTYMMWYTSENHYSRRQMIRTALSADGIRWWPEGVAISDSQPGWNFTDVGQPTVLLSSSGYAGSMIDMWFMGLRVENGSTWAVYHARGDGFTFSIDGVAFAPGNDTWYSSGIFGPRVVQDGTGYRMYFTGQGNSTLCGPGCWTSHTSIGVAESTRPLGFTSVGIRPVLDVGPSGAWDSAGVSLPDVTGGPGNWAMYFEGTSGNGGSVGIATSADGLVWTKESGNPVLAPPPESNAWNAGCICGGVSVSVSHQTLLYYTGATTGLSATAVGYAVLASVSVPLWSASPLIAGFILGVAVSTAVVARLWHPWTRKRPPDIVLDWDDQRTP